MGGRGDGVSGEGEGEAGPLDRRVETAFTK